MTSENPADARSPQSGSPRGSWERAGSAPEVACPYRQLQGQLLGDRPQQRVGGLLGAEQDQPHRPVSPQEEAFRQEADPHHAFQDPSGGVDTGGDRPTNARVRRGAGDKGSMWPYSGSPAPLLTSSRNAGSWLGRPCLSFSSGRWAPPGAHFAEYLTKGT